MSQVTLTVRLDKPVADALRAKAKAEERSVAAVLRLLAREYTEKKASAA